MCIPSLFSVLLSECLRETPYMQKLSKQRKGTVHTFYFWSGTSILSNNLPDLSYIDLMYSQLIIFYFCCISKYVKLKASDCMQITLREAF